MSDESGPQRVRTGDPAWDRAIHVQGASAEIGIAIEKIVAERGLTFPEVVTALADALQSHAKSARQRQRSRKPPEGT